MCEGRGGEGEGESERGRAGDKEKRAARRERERRVGGVSASVSVSVSGCGYGSEIDRCFVASKGAAEREKKGVPKPWRRMPLPPHLSSNGQQVALRGGLDARQHRFHAHLDVVLRQARRLRLGQRVRVALPARRNEEQGVAEPDRDGWSGNDDTQTMEPHDHHRQRL